MDLKELLAFAVKNKGAEMHLEGGLPPQLLANGKLLRVNVPPVSASELDEMLKPHLDAFAREQLRKSGESEHQVEIAGLGTFRVQLSTGKARFILPVIAQRQAAAKDGKARRVPPISLQVQNALGSMFVALGVTKRFGGIDLIPAEFRFDGYDIAFIVVGVILSIPILVFFLNRPKERKD